MNVKLARFTNLDVYGISKIVVLVKKKSENNNKKLAVVRTFKCRCRFYKVYRVIGTFNNV